MTATDPHRPTPEPLPPAWAEALTDWSDDLARRDPSTGRGPSPATATAYARDVGAFAHDCHRMAATPWAVTGPMIAVWLDAARPSKHGRRRAVIALRSFYARGLNTGHLTRSPLAGIATTGTGRRTTGPEPLPIPPAWAEALTGWLTHLRASAHQPGTIRTYRTWLVRVARTFAAPELVTAEDLALFLSADDWTPETKRSVRATLRSFYRWAHAAGHVPHNPAADLAPVRVRRATPRPAPDSAVLAALAAADDRTRLALSLALFAGLRRAEVAALHTRDITDHTIRVRGKGGDERLVPLHPTLAAALSAELDRRRRRMPATGWSTPPEADGWLFPGANPGRPLSAHRMGAIIGDALPPGWTAHTLRHRFATQAYAATLDLRAVQELLGHSRPETTARYAAVPSGSLRAAVAAVNLPTPAAAPERPTGRTA